MIPLRFTTTILLLAICFLGGVMYGSFETSYPQNEIENVQPVITEPVEVEDDNVDIEMIQLEDEQEYLLNKTASFFETIVSALYEGVIYVMYKFAELFF